MAAQPPAESFAGVDAVPPPQPPGQQLLVWLLQTPHMQSVVGEVLEVAALNRIANSLDPAAVLLHQWRWQDDSEDDGGWAGAGAEDEESGGDDDGGMDDDEDDERDEEAPHEAADHAADHIMAVEPPLVQAADAAQPADAVAQHGEAQGGNNQNNTDASTSPSPTPSIPGPPPAGTPYHQQQRRPVQLLQFFARTQPGSISRRLHEPLYAELETLLFALPQGSAQAAEATPGRCAVLLTSGAGNTAHSTQRVRIDWAQHFVHPENLAVALVTVQAESLAPLPIPVPPGGLLRDAQAQNRHFARLHYPPWILRRYDVSSLMRRCRQLCEKLRCETRPLVAGGTKLGVILAMTDPVHFTQALAASLPLSLSERTRFLQGQYLHQRLRLLLNHMLQLASEAVLACAECDELLSSVTDIFSPYGSSALLGTHANPAGYIHQICTLKRAEHVRAVSDPTLEATWFPGYAWSILICDGCQQHLGWRFEWQDPQQAEQREAEDPAWGFFERMIGRRRAARAEARRRAEAAAAAAGAESPAVGEAEAPAAGGAEAPEAGGAEAPAAGGARAPAAEEQGTPADAKDDDTRLRHFFGVRRDAIAVRARDAPTDPLAAAQRAGRWRRGVAPGWLSSSAEAVDWSSMLVT